VEIELARSLEIDDLVVVESNRALVGRVYSLVFEPPNHVARAFVVWSTNLQDLNDTIEALAHAFPEDGDLNLIDVADLEYVERWDYWKTK
jgi:hypothetical protein